MTCIDSNISFFKSAFSTFPMAYISIGDYLDIVRTGLYHLPNGKIVNIGAAVEKYRRTFAQEDKKILPAVTMSGTFFERRASCVEEYNGIIAMDIDYKDNVGIDWMRLKKRLQTSKSLIAYHHSVGGKGIVTYHLTDNIKIENHAGYFKELERMYSCYLGINVDVSCKDISRLRFVSYDSDLFVNSSVVPLHVEVAAREQGGDYAKYDGTDLQKTFLSNQIDRIVASGIDITQEYKDWIDISFVIADLFGEDGRQMFHAVSMAHPKYSYGATDRKYDSALRSNNLNKVTVGTFNHIAAKYGINNRRNNNEDEC